ncbi:hypothetical protein SAMN05421640_1971 [Ekhidna lutea]|uniref:Uncharacterized protein n=1 Tax=Ekhidna lutea TaxID=447679 RepID=A0A239J3L3_EKHLU|nr:hypothetical protein [Ekhidna lutea]SNT00399.1 hypothetical protein SAMN05421640_1971 [Ekhidna lutea]
MKLFSLTIVFFGALLSNCQEQVQSSDVQKIEFGTSFGMCAGYCVQTLTVTEGHVSKTVTPRVNQNLEEKTCQQSYQEFNSLMSGIDTQEFLALDETIGCPDCADGGAEWIEITTPEGSKKVTYEFGKEPEAVKSIIEELRVLYAELGECE